MGVSLFSQLLSFQELRRLTVLSCLCDKYGARAGCQLAIAEQNFGKIGCIYSTLPVKPQVFAI